MLHSANHSSSSRLRRWRVLGVPVSLNGRRTRIASSAGALSESPHSPLTTTNSVVLARANNEITLPGRH